MLRLLEAPLILPLPEKKKPIMSYHFVCLILLVCVSVHIPSLSKLWKEDGVSDKDSEIDGLH